MLKGRVRRSRDEWVVLLDEFDSSGFNRSEFCERYSISVGSFSKWRRILCQMPRADRSYAKPSSGFIPIEIKAEPTVETDTGILPPLKVSNSSISVEFLHGCKPCELSRVMEMLHAS